MEINLTCCAGISIAGVPSSIANKLVMGQINSLVLKKISFNTGGAEGIPKLTTMLFHYLAQQVNLTGKQQKIIC